MFETLKRFAWYLYDNLGGVVVVNIVWVVLSVPWLAAAGLLASWGTGIEGEWAAPAAIAAVFLAAELVALSPPVVFLLLAGRAWSKGQVVEIKPLLALMPRYLVRAQLLGLAVMGISMLLIVNVVFYHRALGGWMGTILSGVMIWFLVAVLLVSTFLLPVLISQTEDVGIARIVRQSFLLTIDNLAAAIGLLISVASAGVIAVFTGVGLLFGIPAALALLVSVSFQRLLHQYGIETGVGDDAGPRSWRDLLRPWE